MPGSDQHANGGRIGVMPAIPASTKTSLAQRLRQHARDRWPQLTALHIRYYAQCLRDLGIHSGQDRSTALFHLAADLPAAVLARMLGIHITVAVT
jgi:hypothetical protein